MDRKHPKFSKTVWMVSVSITELKWQSKPRDRLKQEVEFWIVDSTSRRCLLITPWAIVHWALPIASTRCRQSLQSVLSLLLSKLSEWDALEIGHSGRAITIMTPAALSTPTFGNVLKHIEIVPLESYWLSCWNRPWRFMLYNVWHVWTNLNVKKKYYFETTVARKTD